MKHFGLTALCVALMLAGCGHKPDIVGKWKADAGDSTSIKSYPGGGLVKSLQAMFSFEFKKDNTFVGPMTMEGTYAMDGNKVTLTISKMMGIDVSKMPSSPNQKPMVGQLSDDGNTITIQPNQAPGQSSPPKEMKLTRDSGQ